MSLGIYNQYLTDRQNFPTFSNRVAFMIFQFWKTLGNAIFSPKIDDSELEATLASIKQQLPTPVFWLLGKTQTGKTAIIRALTQCDDAEIGNGFQPCTRTARLYDFPSEERCVIRFLDTRGLGEIDYDPSEDIQLFQNQAHVLIVVVKAMDHAQQSVIQTLHAIVRKCPQWPIIVVQTTLHEGYPSLETEHTEPYPYVDEPLPTIVPEDLTRSLLKQRELFKGLNVHFVPVDFTSVEEGYYPVNYGLEVLWNMIEHVFPFGIQGMIVDDQQEQIKDIYARTAHAHIITYSLLAGGASLVPVPFVDIPLVLSIQAKMFHTLASLYDQKLTSQRFAEMGSVLGMGFLIRLSGRELTKIIPVYGSVITSTYTAAATYALGKTVSTYFSYLTRGDLPDKTVLAKIYAEELEQGRKTLSEYLKLIKTA